MYYYRKYILVSQKLLLRRIPAGNLALATYSTTLAFGAFIGMITIEIAYYSTNEAHPV